jgi:hypothetical protein
MHIIMNVLKENDYLDRINAYTLSDWKPLLDLIPDIEAEKKFGEAVGGGFIDENTIELPNYLESLIVISFREIVYQIPIMIDFDWSRWNEGRKMAGDKDFDFDTVDIPTKCKIITAIVRNDRFCDGALVDAFQRGLILKVLKSIEKQLYTK